MDHRKPVFPMPLTALVLLGACLSACDADRAPFPAFQPPGGETDFPSRGEAAPDPAPPASATYTCQGSLSAPDGSDRAPDSGKQYQVKLTAGDDQKSYILAENGRYAILLGSDRGNLSLAVRTKSDDRQVGYALVSLGAGVLQLSVGAPEAYASMACSRDAEPDVQPDAVPELLTWSCHGSLLGEEEGEGAPNNGSEVEAVSRSSDDGESTVLYENDRHQIVFTSHQGKVVLSTVKKRHILSPERQLGYGAADMRSRTLQFGTRGEKALAWVVCNAR